MKRSELTVGDVLYYAKPRDWENDTAGYQGARVVVASVAPHARGSYGRMDIYETSKGTGVLVEFVRESGTRNGDTMPTSIRHNVVQLAHLRGPYDEIAAEVETRKAARRETTQHVKAQRAETLAGLAVIVGQARAAGLGHVRGDLGWQYSGMSAATIEVDPLELKALLDRLAEAERKADDLLADLGVAEQRLTEQP